MSFAAFSRLVLPSMNRSNPSAGCEHPGVRREKYHHRQSAFEPRAANADQLSAILYDSFGESLRSFLAREQLAYALGSRCGAPLASSSIVMVDTAMIRLSVTALPDNRIRFAFFEALPPPPPLRTNRLDCSASAYTSRLRTSYSPSTRWSRTSPRFPATSIRRDPTADA